MLGNEFTNSSEIKVYESRKNSKENGENLKLIGYCKLKVIIGSYSVVLVQQFVLVFVIVLVQALI